MLRDLLRWVNWAALGLWMLGLAFLLCSCSAAPQSTRTPVERLDFSTPLAVANGVTQGLPDDDITTKNPEKLGLSENEAKAIGCSIKDRFDTTAAIAYNFDDRQSRLALHLSMDGPSFSDPTRMEFNAVMVRYTHKFSAPPQSRQEKCRVASNVQGIIGSAYNELFLRNNYTVWKEIRQKFKQ